MALLVVMPWFDGWVVGSFFSCKRNDLRLLVAILDGLVLVPVATSGAGSGGPVLVMRRSFMTRGTVAYP